MKKKIALILLSILFMNFLELYSQEECKVLKQEIADKYNGKCKNGLAHGKGIAKGIDMYEGQFKNGLPHGKGKYIWANGDIYEGYWKLGKRDGEGKFWYKKNSEDSMKYGVWKEDVFKKRIIPNPYRILKSINVTRFSVQKFGDGNRVLFSFIQNGKPNETVTGIMYASSSGSEYSLGSKNGFNNVVFPYTCKITYKYLNALRYTVCEAIFELEIREPGNWEVILNN